MYKQSLPRLISKGLVIEKQVKNNANKINVSLSSWCHLWSMQSHTKSFARIESDWTLRLVLQFWFTRFTAIRSHLNFYAKSNYAIDHAPCPRRTVFWEWPIWHILVLAFLWGHKLHGIFQLLECTYFLLCPVGREWIFPPFLDDMPMSEDQEQRNIMHCYWFN